EVCVVIVADLDVIAASHSDRAVESRIDSSLKGRLVITNSRVLLSDFPHIGVRAVRRMIVCYDQFEIGQCLAADHLNTIAQMLQAIVSHHHDTNSWHPLIRTSETNLGQRDDKHSTTGEKTLFLFDNLGLVIPGAHDGVVRRCLMEALGRY